MHSRRFWSYVHRYRRAYLAGYAAAVVAVATAQLSPWVLRSAIDGMRSGVSPALLAGYAGVLVALGLLEASAGYAMRTRILGASHRIEADLRRDYVRHLQRMHVGFFQEVRTGDLMARAVNDIRAVQRLAGVGLMRSFHTSLMILASVAFMLSIDAELTAWTVLFLAGAPLLLVALGREIRRRFDDVQAQFGVLSTRAQEIFSGIRVIKAFACEEVHSARFREESEEVVAANLHLARIQGALWPALGLLLGTASVALLWQGGDAVLGGRITLGQLVQFSYYLARLSGPVIALGWVTNLWQQGQASMTRLDETFAARPAIGDPPDAVVLADVRGEIAFHDVSVTAGGTPVLRGVTLTLPAGRTVALVGPSGSGKSTLAHLVPRLLDPTAGRVLVDGHDVRRIALASLRRAVALVPQEAFLFSTTLHDNIALGAPDGLPPVDPRVVEAAEAAQLARDAEELPSGYSTVVGERGITLSGGQRQRAALARALVREAPILILDDALSNVDARTEQAILRRLREVAASRTVLLISHRVSTVRDADWIVVLDRGRVVEQGTHDDLLRRGGLYARLYERQMLQDALDSGDPGGSGAGRGMPPPRP
jgi:ATP-binding cassette subfamily B protein